MEHKITAMRKDHGHKSTAHMDLNKNLKQDFRHVKESLGDAVGHAKQKGDELVDHAKEKTTQLQGQAITLIKEYPLMTVGCSVLAGFVLALLIRK